MATAFYPMGMESYNNTVNQGGYKTWKGTGINQNPIGITSGHMRPLTNKDYGNVFPSPFGKARPLKQYRKGRNSQNINLENTIINETNPSDKYELTQIQYNLNRYVKSSNGSSLGQGRDGGGLLSDIMDKPGSFIIQQNESPFNDVDCKTCQGVKIVDSYYPNKTYLTENPEPNVTNQILCCNEEKKALDNVIYASTNLKQNYYTTHFQYLQNRCQTYAQKSFPYSQNNKFVKPGSPLSEENIYFANCFPNVELFQTKEIEITQIILTLLVNQKYITETEKTEFLHTTTTELLKNLYLYLTQTNNANALVLFQKYITNPYLGIPYSYYSNQNGCKRTVYKPNNPQFAQQGAVQSSTRTLKKKVTTIETNAASFHKNIDGNASFQNVPFLYKNKDSHCNQPPICPFQNKKYCKYASLPSYSALQSKPSPYNYNIGVVFSSNHYSQSPKVGIYTTPKGN
jgi:hypothetical protein